MMNPFSWLQMTNMISYQRLVRTFLRCGPMQRKLQAHQSPQKLSTRLSTHLATYFDTDRTDTPPGLSTDCCSATQQQ